MAEHHDFVPGQKLRVTPKGGAAVEVTVRGTHETGITAWLDASAETDAEKDQAGVVTYHFEGDMQDATYEVIA